MYRLVQSCTVFDMNFQFAFNGTPIEPHEAVALLEASSTKGPSKPVIDISNLIDSRDLDAGKLFEMAVSNQNQGLASLAWKISVQQNQARPRKVQAPVAHSSSKILAAETDSIENIIEHLNSTTTYTSLGVALLLRATSDKEWVTLREAAIHYVNDIILDKLGLNNSKFLRGFEWTGEQYMPVDLSSGQKRRNTFHVSPLYISLREGLVYCKKHELVNQKKMLSVGALYTKSPSPSVDSTRRLYYKIKASERGQQMIKMWADMDRYIEKVLEAHG